MSSYYDKNGLSLSMMEWATLFEDWEYRIIGKWVGEGDILVSTVWLGLDHSFFGGPPLIFETMVFGLPEEKYGEIQMRYSTQEMAEEGHIKCVDDIVHGREIWFLS